MENQKTDFWKNIAEIVENEDHPIRREIRNYVASRDFVLKKELARGFMNYGDIAPLDLHLSKKGYHDQFKRNLAIATEADQDYMQQKLNEDRKKKKE